MGNFCSTPSAEGEVPHGEAAPLGPDTMPIWMESGDEFMGFKPMLALCDRRPLSACPQPAAHSALVLSPPPTQRLSSARRPLSACPQPAAH
eukprot:SAG11_NODE_4497_length_1874_cov_8.385915_2_plen_90_part_01